MIRGLRVACAVLSVCGLAFVAEAQMESPHQAQITARLLQQQGNVDLASAIQTAQQHVNGKAINADAFVLPPWQTGGTEQLKFAITCVTDNQLQTVFIDGQSGRVEHVQPAMTGRMSMGGFQPMGHGQPQYGQPQYGQTQYGQPSQPQYQQQPGFGQQPYGSWQERDWQQGQPQWQRWQQRSSGQPWQPGYWEGGRGWQGDTGGTSQGQFQPRFGAPQPWGAGAEFESGQGYEAQRYQPGPYGQPMGGQPMGGQSGQPVGGMSMMVMHPHRASQLIGDSVVDNQNQNIGRIEDLAVNLLTGRVTFAILNADDKLYPIPLRLIQPRAADQAVLNISQNRLQSLPTLDKANWPQTINERLVNAVHQSLGLQPEFGYAGFQAEGGPQPGVPQTQPAAPGGMMQPGAVPIRKATDLVNQSVSNPQGENLGTIKDLVIDPQRARLAYVVVAFTNLGDKLLAVPWDAFTMQQGQIMLNIDQNRLQQAQHLTFTQDNWPDMTNPQWMQSAAEFWGTMPSPMMHGGRMMREHMRGPMQRGPMPGQSGQQQMPPPGQGGQQP